MFDPSSIIVGLEIGTSKVCAVVGELAADGALNIVGVGQARSRGVRKGEIIDPQVAEEDVRQAVVEAEQMADVEIRSVCLGVTGSHLRGFNNRGVHPVVSADREITEEDVQDAIKNAKVINLPTENYLLHAIRQHFYVDGHGGITNPVGMLGARLEVDVHVVHANGNRLRNAIRTVKGLQLEVDDVVFNGLASSLALLTNEQKELGALVIDLGGGTADYAVYSEGVIKHTGVLAVGGDHVSNDLAFGLKVPLGRQDRILTEPTLQLPGHPEVYSIGDATYLEAGGQPLAMVAPAAVQMAEKAAANILAAVAGRAPSSFAYRSPGLLATIGRNAAVAQIGGLKFRGFLAWAVWVVVHLIRLVGFRNRLMVLINWIYDYLFYDRAVRLIIHEE